MESIHNIYNLLPFEVANIVYQYAGTHPIAQLLDNEEMIYYRLIKPCLRCNVNWGQAEGPCYDLCTTCDETKWIIRCQNCQTEVSQFPSDGNTCFDCKIDRKHKIIEWNGRVRDNIKHVVHL
jgi:hypothetical protein